MDIYEFNYPKNSKRDARNIQVQKLEQTKSCVDMYPKMISNLINVSFMQTKEQTACAVRC
jgi:hypothetical protein